MNPILRHDGGGGARFVGFVDPAIHDFHALQIFLDDFFARDLDILLGVMAGPFADAVDHMLFDQDPDLFGQVGPCGELRHPLADDRALGQIALTLADQELV